MKSKPILAGVKSHLGCVCQIEERLLPSTVLAGPVQAGDEMQTKSPGRERRSVENRQDLDADGRAIARSTHHPLKPGARCKPQFQVCSGHKCISRRMLGHFGEGNLRYSFGDYGHKSTSHVESAREAISASDQIHHLFVSINQMRPPIFNEHNP